MANYDYNSNHHDPQSHPDIVPPAAHPSDSERITALEEQLAAAKILLGVE